MNWIFDVALIVIYILVIVICACRGFVKSIWSTIAVIGAFLAACAFGSTVSELILDNFVYEHVTSYAYESVESIAEESNEGYNVSEIFAAVPEDLVTLFERCGADFDEIKNGLSSEIAMSSDELYEMAENIALPISKAISNIIGFALTFLCSLIALLLLGCILNLVVQLPIIKSINCILGAILGVIEGFFLIWVICLIIGQLFDIGFLNRQSSENLFSIINSSRLVSFFCNLSWIDFIIVSIK